MKTYEDLYSFINNTFSHNKELRVAYRDSMLSPIRYLNLQYYGNSLHISETLLNDYQEFIKNGQDFVNEIIEYNNKYENNIMYPYISDIQNEITMTLVKGNSYLNSFKINDFKLNDNQLILDIY